MISVVILTKNESNNIGPCIESCRESDDIWVFDSLSTDNTPSIAKQMGAKVEFRAFDNYGAQREAARQLPYKHRWVLAIDADERPEAALWAEMKSIATSECTHSAFRIRRKDYLLGRWIKYSSLYPSWFIRFYQHDRIRYEPRAVHEYPEVDGTTGALQGHLIHDSFSKGLQEWLHKHVRYASLEAGENLKSLNQGAANLDWNGLVSLEPVRRRKALKQLSFRLPFRPSLRFLYSYVLRGGFLDGYAGYQYAKMLSIYEQMIVLNMDEQKRTLYNATASSIKKVDHADR